MVEFVDPSHRIVTRPKIPSRLNVAVRVRPILSHDFGKENIITAEVDKNLIVVMGSKSKL
jgi:hypothetical protein